MRLVIALLQYDDDWKLTARHYWGSGDILVGKPEAAQFSALHLAELALSQEVGAWPLHPEIEQLDE